MAIALWQGRLCKQATGWLARARRPRIQVRSNSATTTAPSPASHHEQDDRGRQHRVSTTLQAFDRTISSDPWCHMLASPIRRCIVTREMMPLDLMIQLKPAYLPPPSDRSTETPPTGYPPRLSHPRIDHQEAFLPDRILHPKLNPPKPGRGLWLCASRKVLASITASETQTEVDTAAIKKLRNVSSTAFVPKMLVDMVAHQLEQRILQELQLLISERHRQSGPVRNSNRSDAMTMLRASKESTLCTLILNFAESQTDGQLVEWGRLTEAPIIEVAQLIRSDDMRQTLRERFSEIISRYGGVGKDSDIIRMPVEPRLVPLAVAICRRAMYESDPFSAWND